MKKILKIIVPSILMLILIFLLRGGKNILTGIYIIFPIMYIILALICSNFKKELLISLILTSASFLVFINLWYKMGSCIDLALIYNALGFITFLIKRKIIKKNSIYTSKRNM